MRLLKVSFAVQPAVTRSTPPGEHEFAGSPAQAVMVQLQVLSQLRVCFPQLPQATSSVVRATHSPTSPSHGPYSLTLPLAWQGASCVPHLPHIRVMTASGVVHGSPGAGGGGPASTGGAGGFGFLPASLAGAPASVGAAGADGGSAAEAAGSVGSSARPVSSVAPAALQPTMAAAVRQPTATNPIHPLR